jgi:hypothetical protein
MKKYLAFYGAVYYPSGGMDDFIGDYETLEEAIQSIEERHKQESYLDSWDYHFASVWSTEDMGVVYRK